MQLTSSLTCGFFQVMASFVVAVHHQILSPLSVQSLELEDCVRSQRLVQLTESCAGVRGEPTLVGCLVFILAVCSSLCPDPESLETICYETVSH